MLRRADFFRKVQDEVTYGTSTGGGLSLFAAVFLFMLFVLEFNSYLSVQRETAVTMDTSTDTKLRISFDITLHNVPCVRAAPACSGASWPAPPPLAPPDDKAQASWQGVVAHRLAGCSCQRKRASRSLRHPPTRSRRPWCAQVPFRFYRLV